MNKISFFFIILGLVTILLGLKLYRENKKRLGTNLANSSVSLNEKDQYKLVEHL